MFILSNVAFVRRCSLNCMMLFCPVMHRVHNRLSHILVLDMVVLTPPVMRVFIRSLFLQSRCQVVDGWER